MSRRDRRRQARLALAAERRRSVETPQAAPLSRRWMLAICILLAIGTLSLYSPVFGYPFTNYDDPFYVTDNRPVEEGLSWHTVEWSFSTTEQANWHPLTWLSHALDCQFYGLNPAGHHATSVLWHVVNVVLLFLLLLRATGALARSAMVAALFAVHPLNVESVAWIAERKSVLSMFFFLAALGAYGWYARQPDKKRYAAVAVLFALGLGSKPMVITLPFALLLLDYWPLGRVQGTKPSAAFPLPQTSWSRLVVEKLPLLGLSVASAIITIVAQGSGNALVPEWHVSFPARIENALYSYAMYVVKTVWPVHLAVLYPHPLNTLTFAEVALSALFLVAVSVLVWRSKRRYLIMGWLWFLGTMVPMIGLIQVGAQGMADRYMYLPAIGLFLMLVWGISDAAARWRLNVQTEAAIGFAILMVLGVLTVRQIGYWHSSYDLWMHTLSVTRDNYMANDNVGDLLLNQGRPEALGYFQTAASLAPLDPLSHVVIASTLQDSGDFEGAIQYYNVVLRGHSDATMRAKVYANLGVIYRQLGDYKTAREDSERALRLDPATIRARIQQLSAIAAAQPGAARFFQLGLLEEGAGQIAEARSSYEQALQLDSQFAPARRALEVLVENQH